MNHALPANTSPCLHSGVSARRIMWEVLLALTPAGIASVVLFGYRPALLILCCAASCIAAECATCLLLRRDAEAGIPGAAVTGLLLAFCMPPAAPLWLPPIGAVIAIVPVRHLLGGFCRKFINPALTAYILLAVTFPAQMAWTAPLISGDAELPLFNMFLGIQRGTLGGVCGLALLLGGGWLVFRRIINPIIPLTFIGTAGALFLLTSGFPRTTLSYLLSGGLLLGAIIMATDYTSSPVTPRGRVIFGVGCGLITFVLRQWVVMPEATALAVVIMNLLSPYIERLTVPKPYQ